MPTTVSYQLDSITAAEVHADSVRYAYDRRRVAPDGSISPLSGVQETYRRSEYNYLFDASPNGLAITAGLDFIDPEQRDVRSTSLIRWEASPVFQDTIATINFFSDEAHYVPVLGCVPEQLIDAFPEIQFDTWAGLDRYCVHWVFGSDGVICSELTGSRVNGALKGDITLGLSALNALSQGFSLRPNPVLDRLFVEQWKGSSAVSYMILDALGGEVLHGQLDETGIPVADLPKGLYLLRGQMDGRMVAARFIKE